MSYRFFLGGLAGLLMCPLAAASGDFSELTLTFSSSAAPAGVLEDAGKKPLLQDLTEGAVVAPQSVFSIAAAAAETGGGSSLFRNSDLVLEISSVSGDVSHAEIVSACKALDLVVEDGLFPEKALCDGAVYSYSVSGSMIVLLKDENVLQEYELPPGNYMLNGVPAIFR